MHIHVISETGEAKFWIEPEVELAMNQSFKSHKINELKKVTEDRINEIKESWNKHFSS